MNKVIKQHRIDTVIERYKDQYPDNFILVNGISSDEVIKRLQGCKKLNEAFITETIGNKSWTELICDECCNDCDELIIMNARYDEESSIQVCKSCLTKALSL